MYNIPGAVQLAVQVAAAQIQEIRSKNPVIALDGHSSSGKSTLAKDLAKLLHITHIDTGAMYRAVALFTLEKGIDVTDVPKVTEALSEIRIQLIKEEEKQKTILNEKDVSKDIRSMAVSDIVSEVSVISAVRRFLVDQQRSIAAEHAVVMDGRDIGTVVLPNADVKLFVTASDKVRSHRRHLELQDRGVAISLEDVRANLLKRDKIDSERTDSPLKQAEDAVLLDTTTLDRQGMLTTAIRIILDKFKTQ